MRIAIIISVFLFSVFGCKKDNVDKSSPAEVSNLDLIYSDSTITLIWTDPSDQDFYEIEVSYENDTVNVSKGIESLEIINIEVGINYTFTVKTIDEDGNKSTGLQIQGKIDYRLKYTGDFEFFSYNIRNNYIEVINSDTMIFIGNISIIEGTDSLIQINYRSGDLFTYCINGVTIRPNINPDGKLRSPEIENCTASHFWGEYYGHDSLSMSISIYLSEGLGDWGQIIRGNRVDK